MSGFRRRRPDPAAADRYLDGCVALGVIMILCAIVVLAGVVMWGVRQ